MTIHAVTLRVSANVPEDCSFWLDDDGWNGVCEDFASLCVGALLWMPRGKWRRHCWRISRTSCVSIPGSVERRLPDKSHGWQGAS